MFRSICESDKSVFLEMSLEFYNSPAVLRPIDERFHENTFAELMRSRDYLECYIIEEEGKTAGYCLLNKTFGHECGGPVVWIEELYVRPEYQGKGLDSAMLDFVEQENPAARYRLETEPENENAARLYGRKGYEPLGYCQMVKDK